LSDSESLHRTADSPAPFSTWLGIVCLFVVFGVIVLAVIGPSPRGSNYEQMRAHKRMERLKTLREESQKDLTTYAWVDKNKGVAHIPIDRAMELTVAELAQKKPAPAGPIAAAETPAAAAPANAAAPPAAPSASPQPSGTPKPAPVAGPTSEIRRQPAAAINPPSAPLGTQPGVSAPPTTSPPPPAAAPANPAPVSPAPPSSPAQPAASPSTRVPASPSPQPPQSSSGSPSPEPAKTP